MKRYTLITQFRFILTTSHILQLLMQNFDVLVMLICLWGIARFERYQGSYTAEFSNKKSGSARGDSGIPVYPKINYSKYPKIPKMSPSIPKIDQHVVYCIPKISSSKASTYL